MAFKRVLGKKLKNYFIIELDYSISNSFIQAFIISYVLYVIVRPIENELIHQSIPFQLVRLEEFQVEVPGALNNVYRNLNSLLNTLSCDCINSIKALALAKEPTSNVIPPKPYSELIIPAYKS
jgi:hypothetical protein